MKARFLIVLFFSVFLFCLARNITDPDLFWHLATGRWICEHRQLPAEDPFSYTTSLKAYEEFLRAKIILTQYWLANLIQYGVYSMGGYWGLIALRLIVGFLTLLATYRSLRDRGLSTVTSLIVLLPLSYILLDFKGDRPNHMTYLFLAVFLFLLKTIRGRAETPGETGDGKRRGLDVRLLLLPLLMILWANVHGGFILGSAIACLAIIAEFLKAALARTPALSSSLLIKRLVGEKRSSPDRKVIFIAVALLTAGFLNPNGYNIVYSLMKETAEIYKMSVMETMPPFAFIGLMGTYRYVVLVLLFIVPAVVSVIVRTFWKTAAPADMFELLLVAFLGVLSFTAVRYIPLLAIAVTPVIGSLFSGKPDAFVQRLSRFLVPEAAITAVLCFFVFMAYPFSLLKQPILDEYLPEDAVRFIKSRPEWAAAPPRLFNYYGWGGYLLWRLYPHKVVFIDGRGISQRVYLAYMSVVQGSGERMMGETMYKAITNAYSVNYILIPAMGIEGALSPLLPLLVSDSEWKLIFYSRNSLLFTREKIEPDYAKTVSYAIAMDNAFAVLRANPDNPHPYLTVAKANIGLGRRDEAVAFLQDCIRQRPSLGNGPVGKALDLLIKGKNLLYESQDGQ